MLGETRKVWKSFTTARDLLSLHACKPKESTIMSSRFLSFVTWWRRRLSHFFEPGRSFVLRFPISLSSTLRIHWVCFCDIEIQLTALQYDQYDKASSMYNISYRKKWPKHGTWWKEQFLATLRKLWRQITPWTIREVRIFCVLVKTRTNGLSR